MILVVFKEVHLLGKFPFIICMKLTLYMVYIIRHTHYTSIIFDLCKNYPSLYNDDCSSGYEAIHGKTVTAGLR